MKLAKKWKGVMACDVSPVAMFLVNLLNFTVLVNMLIHINMLVLVILVDQVIWVNMMIRVRGHDMTHRSVLIIYDQQFFIAWSPLIMYDMMQQSVLIIYDKQYFIATITTVHAWSVKNHLWSLIIHKIHWYDTDHRW